MFGVSERQAELEEGLEKGLPIPLCAGLAIGGLLVFILSLSLATSSARGSAGDIFGLGLAIIGFGAMVVGSLMLIGTFLNRRDFVRRRAAFDAIDRAIATRTLAPLAEHAETKDVVVRRRIVGALPDIPADTNPQPVVALARSYNADIRIGLARSLASSANTKGVEALIGVMRGDDREAAALAESVLRYMHDKLKFGSETRKLIEPALAEWTARLESILAPVRAEENLLDLVLGHDDIAVRHAALADFIAQERHTEILALTGVAVLSEDPEVRHMALARLQERDAAPRVAILLRSWKEEKALLAMAGPMTSAHRKRADRILEVIAARDRLTAAL